MYKRQEQERKNYTEGPPVILSLALEACNSRRDTFSRAITDSVAQSLERYYAGTDDPDYLEFWDQTEALQSGYLGHVDCIRLPEAGPYWSSTAPCFAITVKNAISSMESTRS